ncbi:MAG: glycosyltransferase [Kiritimatiellaeota bacterium]|nr:glycosyltransferase [Kiritimatiellota bacterium]
MIYTGHLNIASDLDAIFPAVNQVMTQHHDVHFIVGGGGPMLAAFQAQARAWPHANRIYFTGHCAPERINEWLNAADLALVYYKDRPVNLHRVSMKIRECLAAGIPVACNDVGDLAQFGPVTFQSKTSVDAFAAMIQQALDSPSTTRAALAQAGRVWVAERFDWAEIGRRFSQRLEELVAP